jgi:integrase
MPTNPFQGRLMSSRDRVAVLLQAWRPLSRDEQADLMAAVHGVGRDIIEFALETGMRQSEILNLSWDQLRHTVVTFTPASQKEV